MPPPSLMSSPDALFLGLQAALAGEYSLERELGRGGMGVVYLAREVRLARQVAIKVLPPELASDPDLRAQFLREAQTAARLSHPNIVPIHRVDETRGYVYFVMAYIDGETLAERVRTRGPLAPHVATRVLREVAWALTYAHASGIVHRDIKADNILLERNGERALVTDFGIASAAHTDARTSDGLIAGSPHYASPEQISGQPVDAASDLYSLGVTGFLALTGRLPFDAPTTREVVAMHLNTRPPTIASLAPTVPPKLAQTVERCLNKRPEQRYRSATDFADALDGAIEPPRDIPAPIRVWLSRQRQTRVATILGAYLGLGTAMPLAIKFHHPILGVGLATLFAVCAGALPFFYRTRRVLQAGYGIDDLRAALREHWARRREEEAYDLGADGTGGVRVAVGVFGVGLTMFVSGLAVVNFMAAPPAAAIAAMSLGSVLSVASGVGLVIRLIRRRNTSTLGARQIRFYDGRWGKRWLRFAGIGLDRAVAQHSLPQLTEVALGRATDALYDALPKPLRKQLGTLPAAVRRLEDDARKLRGDVEKLDQSIATLDSDAGAVPSALADSPHEDRLRVDRDRLRADLRVTRERAAERLGATVAALENIRLDLMRLQLGDGQVAAVTATLEAAQAVAADLGAYAAASAELDAELRATRTATPATPTTRASQALT